MMPFEMLLALCLCKWQPFSLSLPTDPTNCRANSSKTMSTKGGSGVIYTNDTTEKRPIWMENPFSLKIGQVFTGFGVGCGVGIGVGRPLNLGAIPVLSEVMIAARGATDAFSGVHRHVNSSLRKVGAKHIEAGIGCGVGFGHGFGVDIAKICNYVTGLAVKPAVLRQIQSKFSQLVAQTMEKLGIGSNSTLSIQQANLPKSLQKDTSTARTQSHENRAEGESISPLVKTSELNPQHSSRTENVINNFLHNPLLQEKRDSLHEQAGTLQSENNVLQMVP
ncbi:mitochondrial escape protein 2 [Striga asiatica]|uniref:Mitochondrial escape protein 2 n=1 Tax=Striga asiatica TaxID=4170 RepID=A0A5A7PQ40_STRAF|nr:mitochondrial escape protein 2 [Striga asiatica]